MPPPLIPSDLMQRLQAYAATHYTGRVELHFHQGVIDAASIHFDEEWRRHGPNFPRPLPLPPEELSSE